MLTVEIVFLDGTSIKEESIIIKNGAVFFSGMAVSLENVQYISSGGNDLFVTPHS